MLKIIREQKRKLRIPLIIFVAVVSISLVGFFADWGGGGVPPVGEENQEMEETLQYQIEYLEDLVSSHEQELEENPGDLELIMELADTKYQLAYFYHETGNFEATEREYRDCVDLYKKVLDEEPDNFDAVFGLAVAASQLGESELADENFEKAMELDSEDPFLLANYGVHKIISDNDFEGALELFKKGLELEPEDENLRETLQYYISITEDELQEEN